MSNKNIKFLEHAIKLAKLNVKSGGGPFGAVIVCGGKIIARSANNVARKNDPTAHAEIEAIRKAAKKLKTFDLSNCEIYSSCEPCPMCMAAIYWAGLKALHYGATKEDASKAGFIDAFIYKELSLSPEKRKLSQTKIKTHAALEPFAAWEKSLKKIKY
ncbi:MAG: nucleoside deaminase [Elusimicrobia bacterium]|nr:nucleoside deaminase [Elusimicrobiota bacterium]